VCAVIALSWSSLFTGSFNGIAQYYGMLLQWNSPILTRHANDVIWSIDNALDSICSCHV